MMTSAVTYALVVGEKQYPLQIGKNVVGRSSVPVDGVSFINLESPLAAISRMQAFLDVAPNGDAWVSDCNSTNGTFISIRPGAGIRLEANRYYQLTPGCRVVFGDVECSFEVLCSSPHSCEQAAASPACTATQSARKTERLGVNGASVEFVDTTDVERGDKQKTIGRVNVKVHRSDVPYLDDSNSLSPEYSSTVAAPPAEDNEEKAVARSSRVSSPSPAPAKKAKRESARIPTNLRREKMKSPAQPVGPMAGPPLVCLSGMESDERTAVTKRVRQLKGRVVENISKANLLVVATPPVRTPKLIIAVARGIPVVPSKYICNDQAELEDARRHIVSLKTDQHTYTSAALEKVIYRKDNCPLLRGVRINVSALSSKTKNVAAEIITASGGEVTCANKGDILVVTDDQLDAFYDSILRGRVPPSAVTKKVK
ncbi:hypothetical protein ABL78_2679 [Leptomonas seymouri]|uniref:FHA domain-containing protein n=1 Tax=Leptomonas seymouri TaxID=5684 RepID=A0A0N1ILS6_LEPSE|nr:hypothetical protein ABL78_2679 [Leptomonas seymouri]|eukprot:KPI88255.1 hypothetical protein ABL78_2679 [Leptomonas seymouri]